MENNVHVFYSKNNIIITYKILLEWLEAVYSVQDLLAGSRP